MTDAPHGVEPSPAPGLPAALRRNPERVRTAAAGAIIAGVLLFTVATVALPADADPGHKSAQPVAATPSATPADSGTVAVPEPISNVLASKPVHVAKKAPATPAVISGLAANGIPNVALNAYRVGAARLASAQPGCGIDWALLAGIGREESDHGRFGGAILLADGTSTPRIIGPALDGVHWDLIAAPGNGKELDGDAVYAHALGPMQFIPSTWAGYGTDATGDGVADIFNINDAALGAARYLCAAGGDLSTTAGQTEAVLAYNHSDQYLAQVLALANAYRNGISVHGIPIGNITGALPAVTNTGYVPPADPGAPTAVGKAVTTPVPAAKVPSTPAKSSTSNPSSHSRSSSPGPSGSRSGTPSGTPSRTTPPPPKSTTPPPPPPSSPCTNILGILCP